MTARASGGQTASLPTVDDVAKLAGVSRQTVSNVLNTPSIVRDATRERVQTAIDELGYRPHASARRLRTRSSSTIGIRLDPMSRNGVSGSVLDRYLHALAEQADARGMRIMLFTAADQAEEIAQYRRLRDGADVDALVVTATGYDDPRIAWLAAERVPFIAFGRPWGREGEDDPARRWVDVDGAAGTRDAARHLLGRGHERVGWLGWPAGSGTGDDRRRGWAQAMAERLGTGDAALAALSIEAEEGVAPGRRAVEQRLAEAGGDPARAGLEALVCASDSLALGAMMAVREAGHPRFPVIGFDNTPVAQAVGLSSVDQRLDEVAAATLELLMGTEGTRVLPSGTASAGPGRRLVTPKLVVRRSSHLAPIDEEPAAGEDAGASQRKEH
ncbi:LacI family DNA-binding transcriptional regulator [Homoserinibacter sp. YIM 151385]|uniref:LacI family DNA-binding transcriptional regulator n=1 Tax=Homoserinibacter sp. YIM 151385 TaxID=2985506 RepID=UPI0022F1086B|nr:LacI family DNA-binding transcriptional regulator [Homoserinibacter sp. YIM 151385]WBU37392.1 LacI family DNA-binding transcriptional regulator [Homoserinibacter sp. YIM 151385]